MHKESAPDGVERLPSGGIKYRGVTFPGYNKPRASTRPQKKKMVLAKKGDQVKVIHFGQKGYKHNYSAKAKKSYLARSAGIKGKDDKFSANYWARRVLWPSGQKADGSEKKAAQDIHINKPARSKKELASQLHMLQKVIANSSSKDLEYAKYIAEAHANTPKEVAKLVAKLNPEKPDWKIDPELDGAFIRDVLNKKNKTKYYLRRPHLLEEDLGIPLGLKSDMARSTTSPSYPSYHSAVASYLAEHAKKDVPEESRHKLDELARRIQKTRQILGYHTIQDTDEGGRIGRDYALSQLKKKKEKTASQADYRPRGTILLTDGKGNVFAGKRGVDSPASYGSSSLYYFPGGGIGLEGRETAPSKKEILDGVRREALEELGFKVNKLKLLRNKGVRVDMPDWWIDRQFRKRGVEYKGLDEYFVHANRGENDDSLHNIEGDAFKGNYYPIDDIVKTLIKEHKDNPSSATEGNMVQAELLKRLKTASAELKAKKDDHPTQRLKERTELDPSIIEKLRASIKANQDKIPDGHHHVTLDDGSRAIIKELRRRHVLATILASNMDRYPGQDLQYLNTKTAGMLGAALRGFGRVASGTAVGGLAGGAIGGLASKDGNRLKGMQKGIIAGGALGGMGVVGKSLAGKFMASKGGQALASGTNQRLGNLNKSLRMRSGNLQQASSKPLPGKVPEYVHNRNMQNWRIQNHNTDIANRAVTRAANTGGQQTKKFLRGTGSFVNSAASFPVRYMDKGFDKIFRNVPRMFGKPKIQATDASKKFLQTGKDSFSAQKDAIRAARASGETPGSFRNLSRIKNRYINPALNSNAMRLYAGGSLYYGAATSDNPWAQGALGTLGTAVLASRGLGSAARAASSMGRKGTANYLNNINSGAKLVKSTKGKVNMGTFVGKAVGLGPAMNNASQFVSTGAQKALTGAQNLVNSFGSGTASKATVLGGSGLGATQTYQGINNR